MNGVSPVEEEQHAVAQFLNSALKGPNLAQLSPAIMGLKYSVVMRCITTPLGDPTRAASVRPLQCSQAPGGCSLQIAAGSSCARFTPIRSDFWQFFYQQGRTLMPTDNDAHTNNHTILKDNSLYANPTRLCDIVMKGGSRAGSSIR